MPMNCRRLSERGTVKWATTCRTCLAWAVEGQRGAVKSYNKNEGQSRGDAF